MKYLATTILFVAISTFTSCNTNPADEADEIEVETSDADTIADDSLVIEVDKQTEILERDIEAASREVNTILDDVEQE